MACRQETAIQKSGDSRLPPPPPRACVFPTGGDNPGEAEGRPLCSGDLCSDSLQSWKVQHQPSTVMEVCNGKGGGETVCEGAQQPPLQ